jgi:hypothetical protein
VSGKLEGKLPFYAEVLMLHFEDQFYCAIAQVTLFHFEDQLRENAAAVVKSLKEQAGMRVLMLTGDHSTTAERVAKSLGIDEFKSGLKPEDKLNEVKHLSQQNGRLSIPALSFSKRLFMLWRGIFCRCVRVCLHVFEKDVTIRVSSKETLFKLVQKLESLGLLYIELLNVKGGCGMRVLHRDWRIDNGW